MSARILFVDDDKDDEEFICDILKQFKFSDFVFFNKGQAVIEHLNSSLNNSLPAVVVFDIYLPLSDGLELIRTIKSDSRYKGVDIIIYSSSLNPATRVELGKIGVTEIFEKQSDLTELKHTLGRVIQMATKMKKDTG